MSDILSCGYEMSSMPHILPSLRIGLCVASQMVMGIEKGLATYRIGLSMANQMVVGIEHHFPSHRIRLSVTYQVVVGIEEGFATEKPLDPNGSKVPGNIMVRRVTLIDELMDVVFHISTLSPVLTMRG